MSLGVNALKKKSYIIVDDQPVVVLETHHLKMQQRRPTVMTKYRNLLNGKIYERNFAQSDSFEEADVARSEVKFLYSHRDEYWFSEVTDPSKRFELGVDVIGDQSKFLKENTVLEALTWNGDIINISLPIKMEFTVVEAPPALKGDTQSGGNKVVTLDTGATINAPLFISEGEKIVVNTETGEYSERAK